MAIREILYPTDFSPGGRYAGEYAAMLARKLGASVHILHVPFVSFSGEEADVPWERLARRGARQAEAPMKRLLDEPELQGLHARTTIVAGIVEDEILKATKTADLIVMGSHGRTGLSRMMLGSVTQKIAASASCPVLVVKHPDIEVQLPWGERLKGAAVAHPARHGFLNILVPLDGSPLSEMALQEAKEIARAFEAVLVLFLVLSAPLHLAGLPAGELNPADRMTVEAYLQRKQEALHKDGLMVEVVIRTGDAAMEILNYATERGIDLIAMTTHGWTGLKRWFLGSVAEKVLRASSIPVLLSRAWTREK